MKEPLAIISTLVGIGGTNFYGIAMLVVALPACYYYCLKIYEYYKTKK